MPHLTSRQWLRPNLTSGKTLRSSSHISPPKWTPPVWGDCYCVTKLHRNDILSFTTVFFPNKMNIAIIIGTIILKHSISLHLHGLQLGIIYIDVVGSQCGLTNLEWDSPWLHWDKSPKCEACRRVCTVPPLVWRVSIYRSPYWVHFSYYTINSLHAKEKQSIYGRRHFQMHLP